MADKQKELARVEEATAAGQIAYLRGFITGAPVRRLKAWEQHVDASRKASTAGASPKEIDDARVRGSKKAIMRVQKASRHSLR